MNQSFRHFGTDLRLLTNLDLQSDRDLGHDLVLVQRRETGQRDVAICNAVDNLKQALLLRFLTERGELAGLGHPTYGSRLFELIGQPNTETTRNRAKMFVLQALAGEPRVAEVVAVFVRTAPGTRTRLNIHVDLRINGSDNLLNLVFPFFLEGDATP